MKESEKRFAQGALFRMTSQKRQVEFASTPGWYFDWDTGQYWPEGEKPDSNFQKYVSPKDGETAEHAERFLKENTPAAVLK